MVLARRAANLDRAVRALVGALEIHTWHADQLLTLRDRGTSFEFGSVYDGDRGWCILQLLLAARRGHDHAVQRDGRWLEHEIELRRRARSDIDLRAGGTVAERLRHDHALAGRQTLDPIATLRIGQRAQRRALDLVRSRSPTGRRHAPAGRPSPRRATAHSTDRHLQQIAPR